MTERNETEKRVAVPWLTLEVGLYGLILVLALALRVGGLDMRIMDAPEAHQALQAWQLSQGSVPEGSYSPLLASAQALLFALLGASDSVARLLPALVGSAMVVLPYLLRSHLGRVGALSASLFLAVSPTLVYSARYGGGASLMTASALALVALLLAYQQDRRRGYLYTAAVAAALLLLSEPRSVGAALVLAVAWAVERWAFGRNILDADDEHPIPWVTLGIVFALTVVLLATALAFNSSGMGAWADYVTEWIAHLAPVVNGHPWYYALAALLLYEPLLIVFGTLGAVDLVIRHDRASLLVWAALGALLLALLAGGRDAGDVALVCAFLAVAAGRAIENLAQSWIDEGRLRREGLFFLVALGVVVYIALEAGFYAFALARGMDRASQFLWFLLLAIALAIVLIGLAVAWYGTKVTWRALGAVAAVALLLMTFSAATGLNFARVNDPRELHVLVASDQGTRDALDVLADVSFHHSGHPLATPLTVEAGVGPVWLWYLRDWEDVTVVDRLTGEVNTPLVLSTADEQDPALGDAYIGSGFVARTWWQPDLLGSNEQPKWWLYRQSATQPVIVEKVIVWMQAQESE